MIIGIPRECKPQEYRVSVTPIGVRDLVKAGHTVLVETHAGEGSGWDDKIYRESGARITNVQEVFRKAEMIVKVKEPQPSEFLLLRPGQILFTFLHLAGYPGLIKVLCKRRVVGIAYETVQLEDGSLPLLAPMSEIAGRLAVLMGANYLRKDFCGKGKLLSGVRGKDRGIVTVIGAGHVGTQAALSAHGLGADVVVLDLQEEKLKKIHELIPDRLTTRVSSREVLNEVIAKSDLLVGAVLVAGRRAPRIVTKEMVERMEEGSVIVDVAIDQGGCVETIRTTTVEKPIYSKFGVIHCGVANLPSLVPRSASEALSRATFDYVKKLADLGFEKAVAADLALKKGVNVLRGEVVFTDLLNEEVKKKSVVHA
ncbi:MAG: alanine dehydrogenase [Deltaproteobacteria bacterium]|nr:alanine dehydrogenase [Deltaproteobacteria bacterium]